MHAAAWAGDYLSKITAARGQELVPLNLIFKLSQREDVVQGVLLNVHKFPEHCQVRPINFSSVG